MNADNSGEKRLLNALAQTCSALAAVMGLVAILGWLTGYLILAGFGSPVPMAPSTALLFILSGSAVFLGMRDPQSHTGYRISLYMASTCAIAALLLFFLSYLGIHLEH